MVGLEYCGGDGKMTQRTDPSSTEYPQREAIRRFAFALRHMILEEIKNRRFSLRQKPDPGLDSILCDVADGLFVEQGAGVYEIWLGHKLIENIPVQAVKLYVRGDTEKFRDVQQQEGVCTAEGADSILEHNTTFIHALVDRLIHHVKSEADS